MKPGMLCTLTGEYGRGLNLWKEIHGVDVTSETWVHKGDIIVVLSRHESNDRLVYVFTGNGRLGTMYKDDLEAL